MLCLDWQWLYLDPFSGALVMAPNGLGYVHLDRHYDDGSGPCWRRVTTWSLQRIRVRETNYNAQPCSRQSMLRIRHSRLPLITIRSTE